MPISETEVSKTINLKRKLSKIENKQAALDEVGEFIRDSILDHLGEASTPVSGGAYKATLSPDYKKFKSKISGNTSANMELYGDMLDSLEYKIDESAGTVTIGIFDESEARKAYGHHTGFKGHPNAKMRGNKNKRQFIPNSSQSFKDEITRGIQRILDEYASED